MAATLVIAFGAMLALTSCDERKEPTYQGWMEAELIFVSPDEAGRIETQSVREGDQVEVGAPLFTLDCRPAKGRPAGAGGRRSKNAQQAYDRAQTLLKTAAGTQKALEDAEAALRTAQARLNSSQTRLDAPQDGEPGDAARWSRSISAPARWCRPASLWLRCCRRAISRFASS